ncbi:hypothetical protein ACHAW5_011024 [Stephanodiscus triporus]|uniref:Uncharacterized protein n=1 Tax=Stephanodiscus triporus TaxID=2934178 RepID=A0ABD3NP85_9STRA
MKLAIVPLVAALLLLLPSVAAFVVVVAPTTIPLPSRSLPLLGMVKTGPSGTPAKSREEDLELTTQVILDHINSLMASNQEGVNDEEVDDE